MLQRSTRASATKSFFPHKNQDIAKVLLPEPQGQFPGHFAAFFVAFNGQD
jgi:hypothetical protein